MQLDSELALDILESPYISVQSLPVAPTSLQTTNRKVFVVLGPLKVLYQVVSLLWVFLFVIQPAEWLVVQVGEDTLPLSNAEALIESAFYTDSRGGHTC